MSNAAAGLAGGLIAGGAATLLLGSVAIWVLFIIAYWKVFVKMDEPGWKCIIPIYNQYIVFRHTWKTSMFWVMLVVAFAMSIFYSMGFSTDTYGNIQSVTNLPFAIFAWAAMIATAVINIMSYYYLSKSFGHGVGFTIGLIFLSFIFVLVLAFGSSRYIGPMGIPEGSRELSL